MPMSLYRKGAEKERKICRIERMKGNLAVRSAGSKTPIDLIIIDHIAKEITLVQAKLHLTRAMKNKLEKELEYLEGEYTVKVEAR